MKSKNIATTCEISYRRGGKDYVRVQRDDEQCEREITGWMDSDIRQHETKFSVQ